MTVAACVGCGHCCRTATCFWGQRQMTQEGRWNDGVCPYLTLVGIQWRCFLFDRAGPALREAMAQDMGFGAGCSSTLFNVDREKMLARLNNK